MMVCCFILLCSSACNGQKEVDDCKEGYRKANKALINYYQNKRQDLLPAAIADVQQAMECKETRRRAIDLKISLLALSKSYKKGYEFVDSLGQEDFEKKYKKDMHHGFFRAMEYEAKADTNNARKLYAQIIRVIEGSIDEGYGSGKPLDQEMYYDLFLIKSKLLSQSQMGAEIDELGRKHPSDKDFFITLKSSFSRALGEAVATPNN